MDRRLSGIEDGAGPGPPGNGVREPEDYLMASFPRASRGPSHARPVHPYE